jgi:flagellar biosynthesis/type III secretory pathway ATPase
MSELADPEHKQAAQSLRQLLAAYQQSEDLINIGAYQAGTNPLVDAAIQLRPAILSYLQQRTDQHGTLATARDGLIQLHKLRDTRKAS